jgi:hypothetical protein
MAALQKCWMCTRPFNHGFAPDVSRKCKYDCHELRDEVVISARPEARQTDTLRMRFQALHWGEARLVSRLIGMAEAMP